MVKGADTRSIPQHSGWASLRWDYGDVIVAELPIGSMYGIYMLTFTINIPPMLAYIFLYIYTIHMDPMG